MPQFFDNGEAYTVTMTRRDVQEFKASWPCSDLRQTALSLFSFTKGGDLVDVRPYGVDGPAVVALSDDAQAYGRKKLGTV